MRIASVGQASAPLIVQQFCQFFEQLPGGEVFDDDRNRLIRHTGRCRQPGAGIGRYPLHQLTESGDTLSQSLVTRTAALDRLATNNTRLTRVFAEHREAFGRSLTDLREVADSLRNAKGNTSVLLARGAALLDQAATLVHGHKGDLDCDLKTLEMVTDITTTPVRLAGLATVLDVAPTAFDQLLDATDPDANPPVGQPKGRWVRVGFKVNVYKNVLGVVNVLVPLNNTGLRDNVTPLVGLEVAF